MTLSSFAEKLFVRSHNGQSGQAAQAPWLPNHCSDECMGCGTSFGLLLRKHHCRSCGDLFCWKCSDKKAELPHLGYGKSLVRVCEPCYVLAQHTGVANQMVTEGDLGTDDAADDAALDQLVADTGASGLGGAGTSSTSARSRVRSQRASSVDLVDVEQDEELLQELYELGWREGGSTGEGGEVADQGDGGGDGVEGVEGVDQETGGLGAAALEVEDLEGNAAESGGVKEASAARIGLNAGHLCDDGHKVSKSKSKKKKDRKAKKEAVAARQQEPAAAAVKSPPVASSPVQTQLPGKQSELPQPQPPHAAVHKPQEQGVLPQGQPAGARVSVVDNKASGLQKVSSSGTGDVNARIKAHKLRALALKRQGKLEEAKAALAQARALEEEL
eukprot:jgi/Mesvir1/28024/Mv04632-RA.1